MKLIDGTSTEFMCDSDEVATMTITEKNTNHIVSFFPRTSDITKNGNVIRVNINNSAKVVTVSYEFNGTGGVYTIVLAGSKGGSFTRRVLQPSTGLPATRHYVFHVQGGN